MDSKPKQKKYPLQVYISRLNHTMYINFKNLTKKTSLTTGIIDHEQLQKDVLEFRPEILICGGSAYPRDFDYKKLREIADSVGAYLMADISHISGLVAAQEHNQPFEYADIVTSTTHKSLRGPRSGIIMFNKKRDPTLEERVNNAVFPMHLGGPHNHQIAALATQMKQVATPEFKSYSQQVKKNAKAFAGHLMKKGYRMISDGTDNHLMLWDVKPLNLTGSKVQTVLDKLHITVNKNTVIGDKS
jgi:glycine hydroxymethyltransferase